MGKECVVVRSRVRPAANGRSNPNRGSLPSGPGLRAAAPEIISPPIASSCTILDRASSPRPGSTSLSPCRSLSPFGGALEKLGDVERSTIDRLQQKTNFMLYFIGPSFVDGMHRDMLVNMLSMFELVKDSYMAMYSAFAAAMKLDDGTYDEELNLRRGALGIKRMKDALLPSRNPDEFLPWAGFGLGLILFSGCALGTSAAPVRRLVLGHVRRLSKTGSVSDISMHPVLIYLTAMEINECLLWRQLPTCGLGEIEPGFVDPYVGMSLPVMQFLHDISKLSNKISHGRDVEDAFESLSALQEEVEVWNPNPPTNFMELFTPAEVVHMLAQSNAYKYMALLFIHRLRHKFDSCDDVASGLADRILADLRLALSATREAPRYVAMPFFVASIEAKGSEERQAILDEIEIFVDRFSPKRQRDVAAFLQSLWKIRDSSKGQSWLDLIHRLPPVSVTL